MKKQILLITNGFPYSDSERGFLETEYNILCQNFKVNLLALCDNVPNTNEIKGNIENSTFVLKQSPSTFLLLKQILYKDVLSEIFSLLKSKTSFSLLLKQIKLVLGYSARAEMLYEKIASNVISNNIDLIYTYWCTPATLAAVRLKQKNKNLKVITRFHGYDLYKERNEFNYQPFRPKIAKHGNRLFFISKNGKDYFLNEWPKTLESKCSVFYIGSRVVPLELNSVKQGQTMLVSCSNLIPLKRVNLIIEALSLMPSNINVNWFHFGDGSEKQQLIQLANTKLSNKKNITYNFLGYVENQKVFEYYKEINPNIFITTSSTEGLPVSILEAMSMGIPAIATAVGGIPEIVINNKTGFLLSENPTPQEITRAIINYCSLSAYEVENLKKSAYDLWSNDFNSQKNANLFAQEINSILKNNH